MPTLLDILQQRFPDSSKTTLRQMLQGDRVRVGGVTERNAKREIGDADTVEIAGTKDRTRLDPRLRILYEDDGLVVVEKSISLLTVASAEEKEETAEAFLNAFYRARPGESRVHVVHRLDFDTSGVLVFARTAFMRDKLKELFAAHDIERTYLAIVHGRLHPPEGTFHSFLVEDESLRVRSVTNPRIGKEAITHYRTSEAGSRYSKLELNLETGRRNQIRVHLAEAGHPVLGDAMYGHGKDDPVSRLALHAALLGFVDPRDRRMKTFTSPTPPELAAVKL